METNKQPAEKPPMSDLERITRSYSTGSQSYTPTATDEGFSITRPERQKDPKGAQRHRPPSQE